MPPAARTSLFCAIGLLIGAIAAAADEQAATLGRLVELKVHSRALETNLLNDPADQDVSVYLPPGYDTAQPRYPTVYVLHGFADNHRAWASQMAPLLDRLIGERRLPAVIFVFPNGRNGYLSSYFTNSAVTGNWEDYAVRDLVGDIDARFRTVRDATGRGIGGHSKGAFASIRLAMRHPDIFGSVYAMSPCCLSLLDAVAAARAKAWQDVADIKSRQDFDRRLAQLGDDPDAGYTIGIVALAAAFSPNTRRPPLFIDLPFVVRGSGLRSSEPAHRLWREQSLISLVPRYKANMLRLRAFAFDAGMSDEFADIPTSAAAFSNALKRAGIPHTFTPYEGKHEDKIPERVVEHMLPFFAGVFAQELR